MTSVVENHPEVPSIWNSLGSRK